MPDRRRIAVIGGGPGGYVAAIRAAQLGADVSLVESSEPGGTCLIRGCIPSKTLIHDVELLEWVRRAGEFGIRIQGKPELDLDRINERRKKVVDIQVKGLYSLFKNHGVKLIKGRGRLEGRDSVAVSEADAAPRVITADGIILATGSVPIRPEIFPFEDEGVITSEEALSPASVPRRFLIVGAGVEGCEFAFMYRGFGSEVTLVEWKDRVLPAEDEDLSGLVQREMRRKGMTIQTATRVEAVSRSSGGLRVRLSGGQELEADRILVSVGRKPNSGGLGLEGAGVECGPGGEVVVNAQMETSVPGIFAVGDLAARMMLAHVASMEGKVAAWNATRGDEGQKSADYAIVPAGIFTLPEIGTVGLKEREASERGLSIKTGRFLYRALGRSHAAGETTGQVKVIASAEDHTILGAQAFGPHATDLIHEAAVAIKYRARAEDLAEMIHAHPTFPEVLMEAAEDVFGEAIHGIRKTTAPS